MSGLLRAELLKLRTTRTTWVLLGVALAIVVGVLVLVLALLDHGTRVTDDDLGSLFAFTAIADLLILSLGIIAAAGEFRHGTITAAFLVTPERWPVIVAKALVYAAAGLAYALVTLAVCAAVGLPWLAIKDAQWDIGGGGWVQPMIGRCLYATFAAALGVGLGTLLRNQAAALVGALITLLAVEPALSAASDAVGTWGPTGASLSMFGASGDYLPFGGGVALYLGYVLLFLAAAVLMTRSRDVG